MGQGRLPGGTCLRGRRLWLRLGLQLGLLPWGKQPQCPRQRPRLWSCREKDSLACSLQAAQQQAEELRQEREKLQAAQEELRRQRDRLEEEREDTAQDSTWARRELERRSVAPGLLPGPLKQTVGLPMVFLGAGVGAGGPTPPAVWRNLHGTPLRWGLPTSPVSGYRLRRRLTSWDQKTL